MAVHLSHCHRCLESSCAVLLCWISAASLALLALPESSTETINSVCRRCVALCQCALCLPMLHSWHWPDCFVVVLCQLSSQRADHTTTREPEKQLPHWLHPQWSTTHHWNPLRPPPLRRVPVRRPVLTHSRTPTRLMIRPTACSWRKITLASTLTLISWRMLIFDR